MRDTIVDLVIGAASGFLLGAWIIAFMADDALDGMRSEAVKRGAAEWVVNLANGETTFKWKEVEP